MRQKHWKKNQQKIQHMTMMCFTCAHDKLYDRIEINSGVKQKFKVVKRYI